MPGPDLILPGFYGKLPRAGDFVSRRLPADFVRFWDRWCALHLAARLPEGVALRFALARPPLHATGLVTASTDRAGRRFPLTIAAIGCTAAESAWFAAVAAAAAAAARGELDPDALDARLRALPLAAPEEGASRPPLALWPEGGAPRAVDPAHPEPILDTLLALAEAR
jgi:type VI secretion system protein ImpM